MNIKKIFTKYVLLLLVYIVIVRFLQPYGLKIYYSIADSGIDNPQTIQAIQSIMTLVTFLINLVFVIIMLIDSKSKRLLDWLIIILTFFSPESGIVFFIVWNTYKTYSKQQLT